MALLLLGLGGILGAVCGTGHCKSKRDGTVAGQPTLFLHNGSFTDPSVFNGMVGHSSQDKHNNAATFSFAHSEKEVPGVMTGYPDVADDGFMSGEFRMMPPGHKEVLTGLWVSADPSAEGGEMQALFADIKKMQAAQKAELSQEDMVKVIKAAVMVANNPSAGQH